MKKYSFLLACLALLGSAGKGFAQTEVDVLRYSRTDITGTARTMGFGGANVALGGDASTLAANPAGLGLFRRSEITITGGLNSNQVNSTVYGTEGMNNRNNLHIPFLSAVFSNRKADEEEGDWRGSTFGISFSRQNNFNQNIFYQGTASQDGIVFGEYAAQLANADGLKANSLQELAFETYLIDQDDNGRFFSPNLNSDIPFKETIQAEGAQNQWDLAYGTSYRDRVSIGASLGITNVRFKQIRTYSETNPASNITDLALRDEFLTEGTGYNLKIGAIYRPNDMLRLGATLQTPTWFNMVDRFGSSLNVNFTQAPEQGAPMNQSFTAEQGQYEYTLTTPLRASGGAAVFFGKNGFITADVEYVDYTAGRLNANDYSFQNENMTTSTIYKSAMNYRIGAEARLDVFRARAGYALHGDPFENGDVDRSKSFYTLGGGIRRDNYFIDAAVVFSQFNSLYSPYTNLEADKPNSGFENVLSPVVESKHKNTNLLVTFGWNF